MELPGSQKGPSEVWDRAFERSPGRMTVRLSPHGPPPWSGGGVHAHEAGVGPGRLPCTPAPGTGLWAQLLITRPSLSLPGGSVLGRLHLGMSLLEALWMPRLPFPASWEVAGQRIHSPGAV